MSRSRRKTPKCGITNARSEKQDKRLYNRNHRRLIRILLRLNPEIEVLPHLREHSNPWAMDKDGKYRFNPVEHPELMRK